MQCESCSAFLEGDENSSSDEPKRNAVEMLFARDAALIKRIKLLERENDDLLSALAETHRMTRAKLSLGDFCNFRVVDGDEYSVDFRALNRCSSGNDCYHEYLLVFCEVDGSESESFYKAKKNHFDVLRSLTLHNNVIRYYTNFSDLPNQELLASWPLELPQPRTLGNPAQFHVLEYQPQSLSDKLELLHKSGGVNRALLSKVMRDMILASVHLRKNYIAHNEIMPYNIFCNTDEEIPHVVRRSILSNFAHAAKLSEDFTCVLVKNASGDPPSCWQNVSCIAPELLSAYNLSEGPVAILDYSAQAVFELSMLAYNILLGDACQFVKEYPVSFAIAKLGIVKYRNAQVPLIPATVVDPEIAEIFRCGLLCDPRERPPFKQFCDLVMAVLE